MKYLLFIIAACLVPLMACAAEDKPASPFISIFSCDEANPKDIDEEVCLVGEFEEGQIVYLLSNEVVCRVETQESVALEREVGSEFMITPVDLEGCDEADYYLSYRGKKPASFNPLALVQETGVAMRTKVDAAIRNGYLTGEIVAAFEGTLEAAPILYKPFAKRPDRFLVQYITSQPLQEGDLYGPIFWYAKGKVELVDTQARIDAYFRFGREHFLLLRHECWQGCGEVSEKVMKVTEEGLVLIHQDTSFSD